MKKNELSKTEMSFLENQTSRWLEALNEEHNRRAEASLQLGEATRAAIVDRETIEVTDAIRSLVADPTLERPRGTTPSSSGGRSGSTTPLGDEFGKVTQTLPVTVDVVSYVRHSAPFSDVNSHTRVTAAAWASANSKARLKAGNFGGDCGFFVPGGEGWVSTWANFGPLTPDSKAKTLVVGYRYDIAYDHVLVATLGYANVSWRTEVSVYDIVNKEEVMHFGRDGSVSWAVIGGGGGAPKDRHVEHVQTKIKPGARYVTQFRHTQSSGGGGLIVGGHNKDQLSNVILEFIQIK